MPNIVTNLYIAVLIRVRRATFLRNILQCAIVLRETYSTVRHSVLYFSVKIQLAQEPDIVTTQTGAVRCRTLTNGKENKHRNIVRMQH